MLLRSRFFPGPSNHFPAAPLFGRFSLPALPVRFAHPAPLDECDLSGRFQLARTVYELRRGACSPVGQARQRGQLFEASREPPPKPLLRALTQVPGLPIAVSRLSAARHPIEPVYSSTGNGHFLVTEAGIHSSFCSEPGEKGGARSLCGPLVFDDGRDFGHGFAVTRHDDANRRLASGVGR